MSAMISRFFGFLGLAVLSINALGAIDVLFTLKGIAKLILEMALEVAVPALFQSIGQILGLTFNSAASFLLLMLWSFYSTLFQSARFEDQIPTAGNPFAGLIVILLGLLVPLTIIFLNLFMNWAQQAYEPECLEAVVAEHGAWAVLRAEVAIPRECATAFLTDRNGFEGLGNVIAAWIMMLGYPFLLLVVFSLAVQQRFKILDLVLNNLAAIAIAIGLAAGAYWYEEYFGPAQV